MTDAELRLAQVRAILGLLPSGGDWTSRATYLAFEIASGNDEAHIKDARQRLEWVKPGWLDEVERFSRDVEGVDLALTPTSATTQETRDG